MNSMEEWLRKHLKGLRQRNEYLDDDEEFARVSEVVCEQETRGAWIWIRLAGRCVYDWDAPWRDYSSHEKLWEEYSWVGPASALGESRKKEDLEAWSTVHTFYSRNSEKTETLYEYKHEGEKVEEVDADGRVRVASAAGVARGGTADERYLFESREDQL